MSQRSAFLVWAAIGGRCGGCAHGSVDADGNRHVPGWVNMTLHGQPRPAADTPRIESFGLLLTRHAVLGWSDASITAVRDDAIVLAGCGSARHATVVTKTSIAVLDADPSPVAVSVAFNRAEGYIGPRFEGGSAYPVVGCVGTRAMRRILSAPSKGCG